MPYIYNVTFVVPPEREPDLLDWLQTEVPPLLFNPFSPAMNGEIRKVIEINGETPAPENGSNIALQATFETENNAHEWFSDFLPNSLNDFRNKFGDQAAFFITLLEEIPLLSE